MGHNKPKITEERVGQIRDLIAGNPGWNRTALSKRICELWEWKSPTGQIKDISCRDLLRALDRKGLIDLPAARWTPRAPGLGADKITLFEHPSAPVEGGLGEIGPVAAEIAASKSDVALFKSYVQQHHYLGFDRSVGENMKYFVYGRDGDVLSCVMFGSAAWSCRARDEYIGWGREHRAAGLAYVTGNSRFLIMPWVRVHCLASSILGLVARRVSGDWEVKYGHPLYLLETYVDPRFKGTCYRAANWRHVGYTAGLGRNSTPSSPALPVKGVLVYPLRADFRERLRACRESP
jgi:hypothetical protein